MSDPYNAAVQGYVNVQQQVSQLGLMGGSMQPMDGRGAAVQIPTPPPPIFTATIPPQGGAPLPPSAVHPLAHGVAGPMMSMAPPAPMGSMAMPQPMYPRQISGPMPSPRFIPHPSMPSGPTQMGGGAPSMMQNYLMSQGAMTPGHAGGGYIAAQAAAHSRFATQAFDVGASTLKWGSIGGSVLGAASTFGGIGGSLGAVAAGAVAAPILLGAGAIASGAVNRRNAIKGLQGTFGGITSGGMVDPAGQGLSVGAAMAMHTQLTSAGRQLGAGYGEMAGVAGAAQESGLMRGHTRSTSEAVSRIKDLAEVTKSIVALGEGITAGDAMQMQALTQQLGMNASQFKSGDIGRRLVVAARTAGLTMSSATQGAAMGAGLYGQLGMSGAAGMLSATHATSQAHSLASGRVFNVRQMAEMGGESGINSALLSSQAAFDQKNARALVMGSMRYGEEGFSIDKDLALKMQRGELSNKWAMRRGLGFLSDKKLSKTQRATLYQQLDEQMPDLIAKAQEEGSPEMRQTLMLRKGLQRNQETPGETMLTSMTAISGSAKGGKALLALAKDTQWMVDQSRQRDLALRNEIDAGAADYGSRRRLGSQVASAIAMPFKVMGDLGASASDFVSSREAAGRREAAGFYEGTARSSRVAGGAYRDDIIATMGTRKGMLELLGEVQGKDTGTDSGPKYVDAQRAWEIAGGQATELAHSIKGEFSWGLSRDDSREGIAEITRVLDKTLENRGAIDAFIDMRATPGVGGNVLKDVAGGDAAVHTALAAAREAGMTEARKQAKVAEGGLLGEGSTQGLGAGALRAKMIKSIEKSDLTPAQKAKAKKGLKGRSGDTIVGSVYKRLDEDPRTKGAMGRLQKQLQTSLDLVSSNEGKEVTLAHWEKSEQTLSSLTDILGGADAAQNLVDASVDSGLSPEALKYLSSKGGANWETEVRAAAEGTGTEAALARQVLKAKGSGRLSPKLQAAVAGIDYSIGTAREATKRGMVGTEISNAVKANRGIAKRGLARRAMDKLGIYTDKDQNNLASILDAESGDAAITTQAAAAANVDDFMSGLAGEGFLRNLPASARTSIREEFEVLKTFKGSEDKDEKRWSKEAPTKIIETILKAIQAKSEGGRDGLGGAGGRDAELAGVLQEVKKALAAQSAVNRGIAQAFGITK